MTVDGIEIEVVRKRVKNVNLRVLLPDGAVRLSAPHRTSEAFIAQFVTAKASWIRKQQQRIAELPPPASLRFEEGETHLFLGKPCALQVRSTSGRATVVFDTDLGLIRMQLREPDDLAAKTRLLARGYRRELQAHLDTFVPQWEGLLGVQSTKIRIRAMKRKWGACRPRSGDMVFNLELAKHPPESISYVVLHELAHLIEPSHNARFWSIVAHHMPHWKSVQEELNGKV